MDERIIKTVIKSLAEKIENLETKVWALEYEKKQLQEEVELFKSMTKEA